MKNGVLPFLSTSYVLLYGVTELRLLWTLYDSVALGVYVEAVMKPCKKAEMDQIQAIQKIMYIFYALAMMIISETLYRN